MTAQAAADPVAQVLKRANAALGVAYRYGGNDLRQGLDCSGLVRYAFKHTPGVTLPRTARDMARYQAPPVKPGHLRPGDVLFFKLHSRQVDHVAIYMGEQRFVHAPHTGSRVRIERLNGYWSRHLTGARRLLSSR